MRVHASAAALENQLGVRALALLFLLALAVRLAHVFAMTDSPYFTNPVIDAAEYDRLGWAIAHGQGHPDDVFWHPPGYPYFLGAVWAVAGDSYLAPRLVQALLGSLSVVLIGWIGSRAFGRRVGTAAAIAGAFYGLLVYFDAELLGPSPTIFAMLTAVALAMLARERSSSALWGAAGVVGGLATLVVATSLVVPAVLAAFARRRAPWVLLGLAVVLAPVTYRNYARGGELVLISKNGGVNLWLGNNPDYEHTLSIRPDAEWMRLINEPVAEGVHGAAARSSYFVSKTLHWVGQHPGDWARLLLHKLRLLVSGHEIYRNQAIYPARRVSPVLSVLLWKIPGLAFPFGLLMPLAAVGLWVGARREPVLAVVMAALALTVIVFFVTARYRVVMVPFLLIFAALGAKWLIVDARKVGGLLAAAGALALFLVANLGQGPMDDRMNADAEYSLAMRLGERGHVREAAAYFESALQTRPAYPEAWLNLSVCYDELGRREDAQAAMTNAFALDPAATVESMRKFSRAGDPDLALRLGGYLRRAAGQGVVESRP